MNFPIPLNNFIGPLMALGLLSGAVAVALVMALYRRYLAAQRAGWAGK